jgi:hypothetical protein
MPVSKIAYAFAIACALSSLLTAQSRLALVIGNGAYADAASLDTVASAPEHARHVADGLAKRGIEVLLGTDLTGAEMDKAIGLFANRLLAPDAFGIVYYTGRDLVSGGKLSLIPIDATSAEGAIPFAKLLAALGKARGAVFIDSVNGGEFENEAGDAFIAELPGIPLESAPLALYARGDGALAKVLARTLEAPMPDGTAMRQLMNEAALSGDEPTPIIAYGELPEGIFLPEAAQGSVADVREMATMAAAESLAPKTVTRYSIIAGYFTDIIEPVSVVNGTYLGLAMHPSDNVVTKLVSSYFRIQHTPVYYSDLIAIGFGLEVHFPIASIIYPYVGFEIGPLITIVGNFGSPLYFFFEAGIDFIVSKNLRLGVSYQWMMKSFIGARISYTF